MHLLNVTAQINYFRFFSAFDYENFFRDQIRKKKEDHSYRIFKKVRLCLGLEYYSPFPKFCQVKASGPFYSGILHLHSTHDFEGSEIGESGGMDKELRHFFIFFAHVIFHPASLAVPADPTPALRPLTPRPLTPRPLRPL